MGDKVKHYGFWSLSTLDNPVLYITTSLDNQEFTILDNKDNTSPRILNSVTFISIDSPLYIQINDNKGILPIPSGNVIEYNYEDVKKFKVLCPANTKIMAYGQYY